MAIIGSTVSKETKMLDFSNVSTHLHTYSPKFILQIQRVTNVINVQRDNLATVAINKTITANVMRKFIFTCTDKSTSALSSLTVCCGKNWIDTYCMTLETRHCFTVAGDAHDYAADWHMPTADRRRRPNLRQLNAYV